jgi:hypothetical protein
LVTEDAANPSQIGNLKKLLKKIEEVLDYINKNAARKGAPRYNHVKAAVIENARLLLKGYGKKPTRYREGAWHDLARVLFGDESADLFDYIKDYFKK